VARQNFGEFSLPAASQLVPKRMPNRAKTRRGSVMVASDTK